MKKMRFLITIVLVGLTALTMSSCKKCKNEDPRARIINNGTEKASVQIKTSSGNTVNINNVDPGTSSAYSNYAAGQIVFTITIKSIDYEKTFDMGKCYEYDIAIDASNNITSTAIDRNK